MSKPRQTPLHWEDAPVCILCAYAVYISHCLNYIVWVSHVLFSLQYTRSIFRATRKLSSSTNKFSTLARIPWGKCNYVILKQKLCLDSLGYKIGQNVNSNRNLSSFTKLGFTVPYSWKHIPQLVSVQKSAIFKLIDRYRPATCRHTHTHEKPAVRRERHIKTEYFVSKRSGGGDWQYKRYWCLRDVFRV